MTTFTINKVSMRHRGGSKEYHLLAVTNHDTGKGVIVNRWGKVGSWGQMKTERKTATRVNNMLFDKIREKEARGYISTSTNNYECKSVEEARSTLGVQYWAQMGALNLDHVFPGIDTTGVREAKPTVWKELPSGKFVADDTPLHSMPSAEEELAEKKSNPNWGLF